MHALYSIDSTCMYSLTSIVNTDLWTNSSVCTVCTCIQSSTRQVLARSCAHIVHPGKPCDLFNQSAKKLVTRAAAFLERTPGIRRLQQNVLLLGSTHGQSGIPDSEVAFSLSSGRHHRVRLSTSILSCKFLECTV